VRRLATGERIRQRQNVLLVGSTRLRQDVPRLCPRAARLCRDAYSVVYRRAPRLLHELHVAHGDGSLLRLLPRWAKTDVLILDDWGLAPLGPQARQDLLEVIEDRYSSARP
jgi:DNA replication protein DnaC